MKTRKFGLTSFDLHVFAMACMLCDHMWATIIPGNMWLTNLGRLAFPIFAFMIVEGYYHTKNFKKYLIRLLVGALISEIPFNMMVAGSVVYPFHQNVMWTFLISLICIWATEKSKEQGRLAGFFGGMLIFILGVIIGTVSMVDYYGFGVMMVGVFYLFRGDTVLHKLMQIIGIYLINVSLLGGMLVDITVGSLTFEVVQQGFAVLAMIPILLYNKQQGPHNKVIQSCFYLFYPVHMLVLSLLAIFAI